MTERKELCRPGRLEAGISLLEQTLVGADAWNRQRLVGQLEEGGADQRLLCAADMALLELTANQLGRPVYELLGGRGVDPLPIAWVIYIRSSDALREEVANVLDGGFRAFKLKMGTAELEEDLEHLAIIRELAGEDVEIKVDANGAWTVDQTLEAVEAMLPYNIAGIEGPVPPDADALAEIRRHSPVPIIEHGGLDADSLRLLERQSVDAVKVGLFMGGPSAAQHVAAVARANGVSCYVGSTVETGLGTMAGVHFGLATYGVDAFAADLRGPMLFEEDILTEELRLVDGCLDAPRAPGWGVTVDREQVNRFTVGFDALAQAAAAT